MAAGDVSVSLTSQSVRTNIKDGTVSGGVTISGGAMVFNGVDGFVGLPNMYDFVGINKNYSISGWFKTNNLTTSQSIFYNTQNNNDRTSIILVSGRLRAGSFNGTSHIASFRTGDLLADTWYHFTYNYNSNQTGSLYLNGNLQTTTENSAYTTVTGTRIGATATTTNFYNGSLNNIIINTKVLSPTEISQIYNAGKDAYSPITNGLVAQYSGRDYAGTALLPTIILDTASTNKSTANLFEKALNTQRVNANSKYLIDEVNGNIILATIEEAS